MMTNPTGTGKRTRLLNITFIGYTLNFCTHWVEPSGIYLPCPRYGIRTISVFNLLDI